MNYMTEIKLFNEWLETNELSTAGISLWYGLMYIANRSGWRSNLSIPISAIILRTKMSRSAIYRERNALRDFGLIDFDINDGRQSSNYRILSFEEQFASQVVSPAETQPDTQIGTQPNTEAGRVSHFESPTGTEAGTENGESPKVVSHRETQIETETAEASHTGTEGGSIYKHKQSLSPEKDKKKSSSNEKKDKIDLSFIDDPQWRSLVKIWLDYKESRKEGYKSSLSAQKFLTMLKNLSGGDLKIAQKIIDKSIARNWAGVFELTSGGAPPASKPATGQRIGQIIQPQTDEKREKLLKKFESKK